MALIEEVKWLPTELDLETNIQRLVSMLSGVTTLPEEVGFPTMALSDRHQKPHRLAALRFLMREIQGLNLGLECIEQPYDLASEDFDAVLISIMSTLSYQGSESTEIPDYPADGVNLWTILPADRKATNQYIVLGAHYDSVINCAGANDNATGVACTIEVLKAVARLEHRQANLLLVFFDQEEIGYLGSQYFSKWLTSKCEQDGWEILSVHSVDMVGYSDGQPALGLCEPPPALLALYSSRTVIEHLERDGRPWGVLEQGRARSDYLNFNGCFNPERPFCAVGVSEPMPGPWPAYPHYYKHSDTFDKVDFGYSARVALHIIQVIGSILLNPLSRTSLNA